jgi:hypothetical protein
MNLPVQIGVVVYNLAKLRMLDFYFIDKNIDRSESSDFELLEMDTDSIYIAFSDDNIEKLIKPEMKEEYKRTNIFFYHQRARNYTKHVMYIVQGIKFNYAQYGKRTPGLFK